MTPRQEFLILESGDSVAVYTPRTFPHGTPIGPDAKRLGIDGPSLVWPPATHLSRAEFDNWRGQLEREGYSATLGPYWRDPISPERAEEMVRNGKFIPLKEAFDELLREAERREQSDTQRVGAVESRDP
jgi:hypothetical protein